MSWSWSENLRVKLSTLTPMIYSYFSSPPLNLLPGIMFGQPRLERHRERWLKTQSIHAAVRRSLLASHLFPFWCLLSTRCQRIWSPQMWSGLFSSGNLAHPTISYLYWFIPFCFVFCSRPHFSLKLSLLLNSPLGPEGTHSTEKYVFLAVNLNIPVERRNACQDVFLSSLRVQT